MNGKTLRRVFLDTVPVLTGYVFLGIGFGILMARAGYSFWWSVAMGVFVYAGSAQYLAVELLAAQAPLVSVALTVFMLNARHIFYGLSLVGEYKGTGKKKPYLIFALTDETYSLVTQNKPPEGMKKDTYYFLTSLLDHCYWVAGCALGGLAGDLLAVRLEGIEFVLTALFVTLFVEQWLSGKEHMPAIIGVGVTVICLAAVGSTYFLIPALIIITAALILWQNTGRRASDAT